MADRSIPAFPVPSYVNADGETFDVRQRGMSLRDYFAGQALAGLLPERTNDWRCDQYAELAYDLADAMLKARDNDA